MRLVVQRVKKARVVRISDNETVGKIGSGLLVLVGFKRGDVEEDVLYLSEKLFKLRIMGDDRHKMNLSVVNAGGQVLVVSQFTLYADISGGNRPSFIGAEEPAKAQGLYNGFVERLKGRGVDVQTGSFGDYMKIECELDGPVTILYDSKS